MNGSPDARNSEDARGPDAGRQLEQLAAELRQKKEEFERFVYTISHDLKGPLHTIKGFAELIEQDFAAGQTATLPSDLKRIFDAATLMQRQIDGLILLSRAGRATGPSMMSPLLELIAEALKENEAILLKRNVLLRLPEADAVLFGDPPRLKHLLSLLIGNALKFLGGQPAPEVKIGFQRLEDQTLCSIRDNGIGFAPADQSRLFQLFKKLNPKAEGLGIGLITARTIVESHGGCIWAESGGPGKGACFSFTLPTGERTHASTA